MKFHLSFSGTLDICILILVMIPRFNLAGENDERRAVLISIITCSSKNLTFHKIMRENLSY